MIWEERRNIFLFLWMGCSHSLLLRIIPQYHKWFLSLLQRPTSLRAAPLGQGQAVYPAVPKHTRNPPASLFAVFGLISSKKLLLACQEHSHCFRSSHHTCARQPEGSAGTARSSSECKWLCSDKTTRSKPGSCEGKVAASVSKSPP